MPGDARSEICVVVTGAAGFIGSHLCASMVAAGRRVIGIDNFDAFYPRALKQANLERVWARCGANATFEFVQADICNAPNMRELLQHHRPAAVFHMAALAGVRPSIAEPARYAQVNVNGTVSVLDAARSAGCRDLIFASSSSVYGNNKKVPFSEDDPVEEPISPYAATKRAGELICHTYAHLFGMRIAALRLFTVYGPCQRPDLAISRFMRLIAAGEEVTMFGDGTSSRDYTYIDDIVQGMIAAFNVLGQRKEGGFFRIWNLGNSHPITLAEMIDSIARAVGKPARIKRLPPQPGDVERTWADLKRSRSELGYLPQTTFVEGLRRQFQALFSAPAGDRQRPSEIHAI
jgi:UDP-glucuronate 4-epimerase